MFCSKCGNPLPDNAKFCGACGAPVKISQEASPVPQQPASVSDEVGGIQMPKPVNVPKPEPLMEAQNFNVQMSGAVASVKKSKKGLAIGLSIGGVVLTVILAVMLIFVLRPKDSVPEYGQGSVSLGASEVIYDDEYIYYLGEQAAEQAYIMRIGDQSNSRPEILYEADQIKGDGWSKYPLGALFLWNDKICFLECTNATEQGDEKYEIHWISKDGKEDGTLVSYEQLNTYGDFPSQMEGIYFFEDYLIFGNRFFFYRLDLNTGELCRQEDFLDLEGPACFVAYNDGYYYYFVPDVVNNLMGETLYRKTENSEEEVIGRVPSQDDDDWEKYFSFIPKGDYLYYADSDNIYQLSIHDGEIEKLASYEGTYNRFALSDAGLYYFRDMSLCLLDLETLKETAFDLPESVSGIPDLIYAGWNGECWFILGADSFDYCRFRQFHPNGNNGSFVFWNGTVQGDGYVQDTSIENQETVNTTELYANVVKQTFADQGSLWFDEAEYECSARGVFKIDLMDFNQDGTEELVMLYNNRESIFPFVDVWTVKNGEAVQLFCERQQEENHEAAISSRIYQNGGNLYVPVYDSLDQNPVYVHLYGFDENGEFGEVYQYENNAFYMNQLPDDMEFTEYSSVQFYVCDRVTDYGAQKNLMKESLQTDMEYMLNELGITAPEISSTQTGQSEFDITSMLGEWTLEVAQPNTENVSRHLIRLNADGTMTLRAEDGSWLDYTYTMDETHFYYTYSATGITGGGTYAISGDKIILSKES